MKFQTIIAVMALAIMFVACSDNGDNPVVPEEKSSGIDINNLDPSVRPADDFYQYANGGWMAKNPLPAAYSRYDTYGVKEGEKMYLPKDKRLELW